MASTHLVIGLAVIALNGAAGIIGSVAWLRDKPSIPFWYLLRAAQVVVVVQAGLGAFLLMSGHVAPNDLHYLYGLLPVPVALLAEAARAGAAQQELGDRDVSEIPPAAQQKLVMAIVRRETGIMAVSCLVIVFLALRAAGTSSFLNIL